MYLSSRKGMSAVATNPADDNVTQVGGTLLKTMSVPWLLGLAALFLVMRK